MKKIVHAIFAFIVALNLVGCTKSIEGEVFYRSNNSAGKFSDTEIFLISKEEFLKLAVRVQEINVKLREQLDSEMNIQQNYLDSLKKTRNSTSDAAINATQKIIESTIRGGGWNINSLGGQYMLNNQGAAIDSAFKQVEDLNKKIEVVEDEITRLRVKAQYLDAGLIGETFFVDDLAEVSASSVRTDSDGKYVLKIEGKGDWIIMARARGKGWVLPVDHSQKTLNLSNFNENLGRCELCGEALKQQQF